MLSKVRTKVAPLAGVPTAGVLTCWALWRLMTSRRPRNDELEAFFLTEGDPKKDYSPAARYRAFQYLPLLRERGIRCHLRPSRPGKYFVVGKTYSSLQARSPRIAGYYARLQYGRQIINRVRNFAGSSGRGVVFLQRDLLALSHSRLETYLPLFNRHVVFDFDDSIFTSPSWSSGPGQDEINRQLESKIATICSLSSAVTVANEFLAGWARQHNSRVHVIPTTLCTEEFRPAGNRPDKDVPVIGWVGTSGNLFYLRQIAPALRALAKQHPFKLRVVCNRVSQDQMPELPPDNLEFVEWSQNGEVERIQQFDIGIMPLADDPWTRGKAGFKLIQYMACGVPIVYSPFGANPEVVGEDGKCGLAAAGTGEWTESLASLLRDPARRREMGGCGRERAVRRFDRRAWVGRIEGILREVADHA